MKYNNWKLMDEITVAVRTDPNYDGFTGYIVQTGDKDGLEKAKTWARVREYDYKKQEYTKTHEPAVHTFKNEGFKATIMNSAGGSSQGGRLSFWQCKVEKDGVVFVIGVNDAILADLIKNSEIKNGVIKEELMFARKGGQPGLIHQGMEAYKDATADMARKSEMKSAKKTKKWELGGVYSSITQIDICLGPIWDTLEEVPDTQYSGWYPRTKLVARDEAKQVMAWVHLSDNRHPDGIPKTLAEFLHDEMTNEYLYFTAGNPPARAKTHQMAVTDEDQKLLDEYFSKVAKRNAEKYGDLPRYVRKEK